MIFAGCLGVYFLAAGIFLVVACESAVERWFMFVTICVMTIPIAYSLLLLAGAYLKFEEGRARRREVRADGAILQSGERADWRPRDVADQRTQQVTMIPPMYR